MTMIIKMNEVMMSEKVQGEQWPATGIVDEKPLYEGSVLENGGI
jgi:hypothetical protein